VKCPCGFNLQSQVGGSIQKEPGFPAIADGDLGLSAALTQEGPGTGGSAVSATAVPLRKPATRSRTQDRYLHSYRLQLSAGVGIDLAIQRNFLNPWCGPFHKLQLLLKKVIL
jgi:hypothetical protein